MTASKARVVYGLPSSGHVAVREQQSPHSGLIEGGCIPPLRLFCVLEPTEPNPRLRKMRGGKESLGVGAPEHVF